jgi:hypothetical protein
MTLSRGRALTGANVRKTDACPNSGRPLGYIRLTRLKISSYSRRNVVVKMQRISTGELRARLALVSVKWDP